MAYYECAKLHELVDGFRRVVRLPTMPVLVLHDCGQTYIIENRCPHMDAPLHTGEFDGEVLRCRAHGIAFSLVTGRAEGPLKDALPCLKSFSIVYQGNGLGIDL